MDVSDQFLPLFVSGDNETDGNVGHGSAFVSAHKQSANDDSESSSSSEENSVRHGLEPAPTNPESAGSGSRNSSLRRKGLRKKKIPTRGGYISGSGGSERFARMYGGAPSAVDAHPNDVASRCARSHF